MFSPRLHFVDRNIVRMRAIGIQNRCRETHHAAALQGGIADALLGAMTSPLIWLGLVIYGLSVAMW